MELSARIEVAKQLKICATNQLHCSPCMASRSSTPREVSSSVVALSVPIPVVTEGFSSSTDVQIHPCYRLSSSWQECMVFLALHAKIFAPLYCVKMVAINYRNNLGFYRAH